MNGLIYFRIDERLIHGQVAAFWTNNINATRIMVINDEHANDPLKKATLKMATPPNINLSVLTVEKATINIKSGNYENQRVFVIFRDPKTVAELIQNGIQINELNVGNMSFKQNNEKLTNNISVNKEDVEAFKVIIQSGTHVFAQLIPSSEKEEFSVLLNNLTY